MCNRLWPCCGGSGLWRLPWQLARLLLTDWAVLAQGLRSGNLDEKLRV